MRKHRNSFYSTFPTFSDGEHKITTGKKGWLKKGKKGVVRGNTRTAVRAAYKEL